MSRVIVIFHNPADDMAGKLNQCLQNKNASVGPDDEVACVKFPDGWLIVCYDREPSEHVKQVIAQKVEEFQPERKILLVHRATWESDTGPKSAQQALTSRGGVFEGARSTQKYSHTVGDKFYDGVVHILSHSRLSELDSIFDEGETKTLREEFSHLKHDLGRTLSAIDIDLQGLVASNFDAGYKQEIVETYQAPPPAAATENGKATSALERVRELVHDESFSIRVVAGKAVQLIKPDANHLQQIQQAWNAVQKILPAVKHEPAHIYSILQTLETEAGLNELQQQQTPDRFFHEWFYSLDEALNVLRDQTTAKIPADTNQTTATN